jgi:hypothetical protein
MELPLSESDDESVAYPGLALSAAPSHLRRMRKLPHGYLNICFFVSFFTFLFWAVLGPVSAAPAVSFLLMEPPSF